MLIRLSLSGLLLSLVDGARGGGGRRGAFGWVACGASTVMMSEGASSV
jgi:hypothetical protein